MRRARLLLLLAPLLILFALPAARGAGDDAPEVPGSLLGTVLKGKAPVAPDAQQIITPRPTSATLPNGLRVLVWEDHRLPWVSCRMLVRGGSLWEPRPGVALLTASLLTEGTQLHGFAELNALIEQDGATLDADAEPDDAVITLSGLSEYRASLLNLLAEVVLHPSFPSDRLALEQFQLKTTLPQAMFYSDFQIDQASSLIFYGLSPYAALTPSVDDIAVLHRQDLAAFYARAYRPNGAVIGVVGDVSAHEVITQLTRQFGAWKAAPRPAELPKEDFTPPSGSGVYLIDWPRHTNSILSFRSLAVSDRSPDYIPLLVVTNILGGTASSRLPQNLRDTHAYTYGASARLESVAWPGVWEAGASVRADATGPAIRETFRELHRLRAAPVSAAELAEAKRALTGSFARALERPDAVMAQTLAMIEDGLPAEALERYCTGIQAVTAADVQRVARRYLAQDRMQLIVIGDRHRILPALKRFGIVTPIN